MTLDAAIEEYLHLIMRTRPWTKPQEEEVLTAFRDWVHQQPCSGSLASIGPAFALSYAKDKRLSTDKRDELLMVLHNLCLWASRRGLIANNPFSLVTLVC
jgi:hypothetical protein